MKISSNSRAIVNLIPYISIAMIAITAGYYNIGRDFYAYSAIFDEIGISNRYDFIEKGFGLLLIVFKKLHLSFEFTIFVLTVFTLSIKYYFFKTHVRNPALGILLYISVFFWLLEYTQLRQSISCALIVIALMCLMRGRLWSYLIVVILASFIHQSSLIALLLPIFLKIDQPVKILVITMIAGGINFNALIAKVLLYIPIHQIQYRVNNYLLDRTFSAVPIAILLFFGVVSLWYFYSAYKKYEFSQSLYTKTFVFGLLILFLFRSNNLFGFRVSYYYLFFYPYIILNVLDSACLNKYLKFIIYNIIIWITPIISYVMYTNVTD